MQNKFSCRYHGQERQRGYAGSRSFRRLSLQFELQFERRVLSVSDTADVRLINKSLYPLGQLLFVMEQFRNNSRLSTRTGARYLAELDFGERIALVAG